MESRLEETGEFWSFVDMLVFQHGAIYYNTKYYKLFPQVITSSKQMFSKGLFVLQMLQTYFYDSTLYFPMN